MTYHGKSSAAKGLLAAAMSSRQIFRHYYIIGLGHYTRLLVIRNRDTIVFVKLSYREWGVINNFCGPFHKK